MEQPTTSLRMNADIPSCAYPHRPRPIPRCRRCPQDAVRAWNPARDGKDLQDRIKEWERQNKKDQENRDATWSYLSVNLSSNVLGSVEQEPGYAEADTANDSLALYLMCKTVCLRGILGNTGNCRKMWVAHCWYPGDDVNEWFN
jgi:hypothetical protein